MTKAAKITFPEWTTKGRKAKVATNRLRYLINRLAAETGPENSIRSIADQIGVNYSTISVYISRGAFSSNVADALEAQFGRGLAPSALLQDPLSAV